jgi:hypothetical protein
MYAVIKNGVFESNAIGNTHWSPNHFQTAESLSNDEREQFNLYLIVEEKPDINSTQKWGEPTYAIDGTNVTKTWVTVDKTDDELAEDMAVLAANARVTRNGLLAATDWTAMADAPTQATAMTTYRQALRDITSQSGWPTTVNWPTAP